MVMSAINPTTHTAPPDVLREAAEYYSRNVNSFEFEWLIPLVTVVATVSLLARAWCRRGYDDIAMLVIGGSMGLAVQLWLDPHERALSSCAPEHRQKHLDIVGSVHIGQLLGSLVIVALHWRACLQDRSCNESDISTQSSAAHHRGVRALSPHIQAIVDKYQLKHAAESTELGMLSWKRRMGIHLAYHSKPANWIGTHLVGTTIMVVLVLALGAMYGGVPGLLAVALPTLLLYACCDMRAASLIALLFALFSWPSLLIGNAAAANATVGLPAILGSLVALLFFQVCIGHWWFEDGIDDSPINFAELFLGRSSALLAPALLHLS